MKKFNTNMQKQEEKLLRLQEKISSFHSDKHLRKNLLPSSPKISPERTDRGSILKKEQGTLHLRLLEKLPIFLGY